ncbi:Ulp1 protease family C-terminal catalytic domain [Phytophthora infestans]|uniref:Ulp1 protease family C-terminal catalytic domain n=1 Tax=Phytophthora infestans TaxID=4787 RepID=A0A833VYR1_PHYIN|nr:Ulp1 protease family C-terminal catalytic domain [Phytophthora infestans]
MVHIEFCFPPALSALSASRHHTTRISTSSGPHADGTIDSRYSNTLEAARDSPLKEAVASERSVMATHQVQPRSNWEDSSSQFNFGQDSPPSRQLEGPHAPDKYKSMKPKASGQSIGAPGSSFASTASSSSTSSVLDRVLNQQFIPPRTQDPFLDNITKKNTRVNRGSGGTMRVMAYSTNTRKTPLPVVSRYALRDRSNSSLFGHSPTSAAPFSIQNARPTRLGKRKMSSEGSAAKPIALDSDSESEVTSDSRSKDVVDQVLNDTRKSGCRTEKQEAIDVDEMALHATARIDNCDVLIGLFQCVVDLLFQGDRMCMRNIRGKNESWPFKGVYLFCLDKVRDIRLYSVAKEVDRTIDIEVEEPDRMEQLLDEASFMAFKLPFASVADEAAMKIFYDPADTELSKGFLLLRPLEDASGGDLSQIQEHLRSFGDVYAIDDKEQAKKHLDALIKDPFSYKASRRSSLRGSAPTDVESPSDDVARLKPRRYLNDNIIDYYFKRMMLDTFRDNSLVQDKVLFLNSHFYTRLGGGKGATAHERMQAGYKNVSTWHAHSNFFNRSIIFIPINKDLHWSLAVVLNPGLAGSDSGNEEAESCIAVLDPLGSYHRKAAIIRNLRAFLRMRWENSHESSEYAVEQVMTVNVKAPQQENSYDCGVYVLKFAEVMLENCLELEVLSRNGGVIGKKVTDEHLQALITSSAFSADDITATRKQIRELIEADASEYQARKKEEKTKVSKT